MQHPVETSIKQNSDKEPSSSLLKLAGVLVVLVAFLVALVIGTQRYHTTTSKADIKYDAATLLSAIQAEAEKSFAGSVANGYTLPNKLNGVPIKNIGDASTSSVAITSVDWAEETSRRAYYEFEKFVTGKGEIAAFAYTDGKYHITWKKSGDDAGWSQVELNKK